MRRVPSGGRPTAQLAVAERWYVCELCKELIDESNVDGLCGRFEADSIELRRLIASALVSGTWIEGGSSQSGV